MTTVRAVLGLDIGGSKTRGLLIEEGVPPRRFLVGSANISSVGLERAGLALDDLAAQLDRVDIGAVCAGAAGADSPEGRTRLKTLLAARFPKADVEVVHDTHLILAAAGLQTGAVVIAGTGSAAWARHADGRETRAGGWGYLLGDEGGGYAIARDAVRAALADADHGRRQTAVTVRLMRECGVDTTWQLLDHFYERPERRYWAELAGCVVELAAQADPDAGAIVDRGADALADLVNTVTTRLDLTDPPVVLAGGLLVHQPLAAARLRTRLTARGLSDVRVLDRDPVEGAADLAGRSPAGSLTSALGA